MCIHNQYLGLRYIDNELREVLASEVNNDRREEDEEMDQRWKIAENKSRDNLKELELLSIEWLYIQHWILEYGVKISPWSGEENGYQVVLTPFLINDKPRTPDLSDIRKCEKY